MSKTQIKDLIPGFIRYEEQRGRSPNTLGQLPYRLSELRDYLEQRQIGCLTITIREAQEFQAWLVERRKENGENRYGKSYILSLMIAVRGFYHYLKKSGLIFTNPFTYVKYIRDDRKIPGNILREKELSGLLERLASFYETKDLRDRQYHYKAHVVAELLYSTGARISEIAMLKENDIDFEKSMVKITDAKTGRERFAFLNDYAKEVLKIYIREMIDNFPDRGFKLKEYIFRLSSSRMMTWMNTRLKWIAPETRITSHKFRHCVGYHFLRRGCSVRLIQSILGHATLSSTEIYTQIDKEDLKSVLDEYHPRRFRKPVREAQTYDEALL